MQGDLLPGELYFCAKVTTYKRSQVHKAEIFSHNYRHAMLRFVQYADAGGFIPSSVINQKIPHQLMQVKRAIDKFSRNDEVSIE